MSSSQHYRKKSSKRANEWSDWGQWVWSQTYERYYRQRQDINGNIETMWATERNVAAADARDPEEPRRRLEDDPADALATQLGQVDIGDGGDDEEEDEDPENYSHMPSSHSSGRHKSKSKGKSKPSNSSSSRSKKSSSASKAKYSQEETIEEQEGEEEAAAAYEGDDNQGPYEGGAQQAYPAYNYEEDAGANPHHYSTGYSSSRSYHQQAYAAGHGEEEGDDQEGFDRARKESLRDHQRGNQRGESSRHQSRRGQAEYASEHGAAEYVAGDYDEASEGAITPRGPVKFDISGDEGDAEVLDPRYRVEHSHKFQPGEVFKVLWPEPTGQNVGGTPTISDRQKIKNKYGESFYIGFRRFIVVANDYGHCQCVPILTYGGKGCNKRGVKPEKHGIVHDQRYRVRPLPDEPRLGFLPVRLVIEVDGEKLAKESRVNYSKIVTVEHNVKVFFIGHIFPEDYQLVSDAVNVCWEDKIFQRKRHTKK